MNIDDFVKILIALSVSFAIVIIAYEIARLFRQVSALLKEIKTPVANISEFSDMALEDYKSVRSIVGSGKQLFGAVTKFADFAKPFRNKRKTSKDAEE